MQAPETKVQYSTIRAGVIARGTVAVGLLTYAGLALGVLYLAKLMAKGFPELSSMPPRRNAEEPVNTGSSCD